MEKEINELKELVSELKKLFDGKEESKEKVDKHFYDVMEKAIKEPCEIIIKQENGGAKCKVEGYTLSIIIALIGAEKTILENLNISERDFGFIKSFIGCKEK